MEEKEPKHKKIQGYVLKTLFLCLVILLGYHYYNIYTEYNDNIDLFQYSNSLDCIVVEEYSDDFMETPDIVCDHEKSSALITLLYTWYEVRIYPILQLLAFILMVKAGFYFYNMGKEKNKDGIKIQ